MKQSFLFFRFLLEKRRYAFRIPLFLIFLLGTIKSIAAPVANFTASNLNVCVNQPTVFTNTSTGSITTYSWNFGSGATPATANTVGPHSVTYSTAGQKTISLTVNGPDGPASITKTNYVSVGRDQIKFMAYNLLNYPNTDAGSITADTTLRNPFYRTIMSATNPDILVVGELLTDAGLTGFRDNVMNANGNFYSKGTFINGFDSDNGILYKTSKFTFVSNTPIQTALRDINEFKLVHTLSGDTIRIYAVHLKASDQPPGENEPKRASEIDSLRKVTNALPAGSNFIVCGDFNIYNSTESAYTKLLQVNANNEGHFIDPVSMPGTWNQSGYAIYHTQSPRGGTFGGMDDRFDMILYSKSINQSGGMTYVSGSLNAYGNDGNHYNQAINVMPNTAVSQTIANALYDASDHIPVMSTFELDNFGCAYADLGATSLIAPTSPACSNSAQPLQVQVKNHGNNQENFVTNNLQVVLEITNPNSSITTLSQTVNTGSLNPGAFLTVSFTNTLNMSAAGNYIFNAHTVYSGDTTTSNNSMPATTVAVIQNTAATITPNGPTSFCNGGSVQLTANQSSGITYQWKKNNINISGATLQNYTATTSGGYSVTLQKTTSVVTNFPSATFSNSNTYSIPDISCTGASSTINISGYSAAVATSGISVKMNINHLFVGDLVVFLEAPNGDKIALANRVGSSGDNFVNTIFSDAGSAQIPASGAPYTGTYKPWTSLFTNCVSNNKTSFGSIGSGSLNPNGNWKLWAYDRINGTSGTILNWEITFPAYTGTTNLVCDPVTSSTVSVIVNSLPVLSINPPAPTVCPGASISITASGANTYTWSPATNLNSTTGSVVIANPSVNTSYTVNGTNTFGCAASLPFNITISASAGVTLGSFNGVCINTPSFVLSGGQPLGGVYSGPGVSGGNFSPSSAGIGTHTITYSYNNSGCTGNATSNISVNPLPIPTVTPAGPITVCQNSAVILSAPSSNTYAWSNGVTTQTNSITSSGSYSVTITNANGCTATSSSVVVTASALQWTGTLFTETMGTLASSSIATHETNNRFDNDGFTMTGSADVRTTSPSSGYPGASGGSNVFFTNTAVTNFIIAGINTTGLTNLVLSFGILKLQTASDGSDFHIKTSTDGSTYSAPIAFTAFPTVSGSTADWYHRTVSLGSPNSSTFYLQFIQSGTTNQYRIDDLVVSYLITSPTISASGPTDFCQGGSVNLSSISGTSYAWNSGASSQQISVSTSGIYFSSVTNTNGCVATSNSITVNANPKLYSITGGGSYCSGGSGVTIGLSGSETVVNYQLKNGASVIASTAGTGNPLSFTNLTSAGTYTVVGTNPTAGCTATMTGTATITINPNPTSYAVTGGGSYCAGGDGRTIGLSNSQTGINYSLLLNGSPTGIVVAGTNSSIAFGLNTSAGPYSVLATNSSTGCTLTMSGTVNISINPNPTAQTVTGGGNYCVNGIGVAVGLNNSQSGVQYQLRINNINSGSPLPGIPGPISFGNQTAIGDYTVIATNTSTTCTSSMSNSVNVDVNPNPLIQNVTGGGNYCAVPGDGVPIGLSNSENGVGYKLYLNSSATPDPAINGNGFPLSFGNYTGTGNYTVVATNNSTSCSGTMNGSASVIRFEVSNWYHDFDGDGYGDPNDVISDCSQPAGYIVDNTDCDDALVLVYPGAIEVCGNGIDDNCNNLVDENCGGNLNVKLFIEGFYLGNNVLRAVADPVNYPSACDTVELKLAEANSPHNIFSSNQLVLDINGNLTLPFPGGSNGNSYYLVIKHRNVLETWSSVPVVFNQALVTYDFTNAVSKSYSDNLKDLGDGNFGLLSGDVNQDELINDVDADLIENDTQYFITGYINSDLTGDYITESADYSLIENNIGRILARP